MAEPTPSVGSHDDQVGSPRFRLIEDHTGRAVAQTLLKNSDDPIVDYNYIPMQAGTGKTLGNRQVKTGNEQTVINILGCQMTASVSLVKALGGGWDASAPR